jgi:hypothetical protein
MAARPLAALAGIAVAGVLALGAANWATNQAAAHTNSNTDIRQHHCHNNGGGGAPDSGPNRSQGSIDR